jgi:hypothetical protein
LPKSEKANEVNLNKSKLKLNKTAGEEKYVNFENLQTQPEIMPTKKRKQNQTKKQRN